MDGRYAGVERMTAFLLLVSATLAILIVLYATIRFYPRLSPTGQFISLLVSFGGLVALASLVISTFRHFLQPAIRNGARRARKRNA